MRAIEKIGTVLPQCMASIIAAENKNGISGISSGFRKFDDITAGLHGGELIAIGGRTSIGKTSFLMSMLRNIAIQNLPILLFSLETSSKHIANRLISQECKIPLTNINNGLLTDKDWTTLNNSTILNSPFYIETSPFLSIEDVCSQAQKAVKDLEIKLIAIDYIQLLYYNNKNTDNRYSDINYFTRTLKGLAKELDVPIVIVSQLNREVENRIVYNDMNSIRPRLTDLRDSGTICDDCDIVILLNRPEYYRIYNDDNGRDMRGLAQCIIAKNRNGITGEFLMKFTSELLLFENIPPMSYDEFPDAMLK